MKFEIIGAGSLGMLLAATLAEAGAQVQLVTRTQEQAQALRSEGLLLTRQADPIEGRSRVEHIHVHPAAAAFEELQCNTRQKDPADCVLLTVKQTAITDPFAEFVSSRLHAGARLLCYQNGIGHTDVLSRYIPESRILLAVTTEGALRHKPYHVEHTGRGMTWIGSMMPALMTSHDDEIQKKLEIQLKQAGFAVSLSNQITSKVWNKLLMNAVINPLTAILQVTNGMLPELPAALTLMRTLFDEGTMLATELDIPLAPDLWEQLLTVCRLTANNHSSMLQDVQSRRRTELDSITGGLLAKSREAGVSLPTHEAVYALVRSIEQQW